MIIGSPVWAWTYAPALKTLFSKGDIQGKKIAVFCCHEGGMGKTLEKMKAALQGNEIISEADFFAPLQKEKEEQTTKAINWAKGLLK